ncbi:hypothetical protein [Caudoviricetes sp.]|nr:hypothetical protein [Caudoviricetes sp.]
MKKSLNELILLNLLTELNMAKGKRIALESAKLTTDRIDARIEVLETMINRQRELMGQE